MYLFNYEFSNYVFLSLFIFFVFMSAFINIFMFKLLAFISATGFFFCKTFRIDLNRIISLVMIVHSRREISHVCKTSFPLVPPHWFSSEVTSTVILSEEFADLIPPWDRTSSAV